MKTNVFENTWQAKAACRGPQARVFFPPPQFERKHERLEREHLAKKICLGCPVRQDCLNHALQVREQHGVWGGLSESERRTASAS